MKDSTQPQPAGSGNIALGLVVVLATGFIGLLACPGRAAEVRPNIILILADDFGYECVGANGGNSYPTPALDKLAATGVRFEHCYVQPLCTPTRAQLMTGVYNVRNYITFGALDPKLKTFANLFKEAGYATCMAGKWQLGRVLDLPKIFGFDEACLWQHTRRPPRYANPGLEINGVEKDFKNGDYGPDLVNDYAMDFITRHKDKLFLLYYSMMLTHAPYQPTPDSADWDPKAEGERVNQARKHFGEMTTYMDKLIGKLVDRVDELGLRDRTLILFLGDNGTGRGTSSQMGSHTVIGGKGSTTAEGMRVPLIANWPGRTAAGKVVGDLVDSTDFLPTICDAAGLTPPAGIDGRSFFPQLRGQVGRPRDWAYCWYSPRGEPPQEFTFNQRYKLTRDGRLLEFGYDAGDKPVDRSQLSTAAKAAVKRLEAGLDQYRNARPAELDVTGKKAGNNQGDE
jgi:arylsulfatase A